MGIVDSSAMLMSSRTVGKGQSSIGTPKDRGAQIRTPGDAQMKGTLTICLFVHHRAPCVQVLSASSPRLGSFSALSVLNRNILPGKPLGEISPLCTRAAWKHHTNAKCSTDTEQHCSALQDLSSRIPYPLQTNPQPSK